jgi:Glycosyltransferase family 87
MTLSFPRVHDRLVRGALLAVAALELGLVLALPAPANQDKPGILGGLRTAAAQLRGEGPPVDLVQDYVGGRRLVRRHDAYPVLTEAFASVGLRWPAEHRSTHPPTAFLLVLPVAWLPWKAAAAVWAALMLLAIGGAWWALGARAELAAVLAPLTLVWPPAAWSLGQLTPLWLFGLALAWRERRRAAGAGAAIGLASLTKLVPAVSLVPFLALGRAAVLRTFAALWVVAGIVLAAISPGAIGRYVSVGRSVGDDQAARGENSALLWAFEHHLGAVGLAAGVLLVVLVLGVSLVRLRAVRQLDEWTWCAWCWGGVALLPIAWIYSLLPLAPVLWLCLRRGGVAARALALFALVVPFTIDPFGLPGAIWLAAATASAGLSLLAIAPRPERRPAIASTDARSMLRSK